MLEKEEARKFPVICPHCKTEVLITDFGWLGIFDDLDMFGKTVVCCTGCKLYFLIRDEDEDGPFITK